MSVFLFRLKCIPYGPNQNQKVPDTFEVPGTWERELNNFPLFVEAVREQGRFANRPYFQLLKKEPRYMIAKAGSKS